MNGHLVPLDPEGVERVVRYPVGDEEPSEALLDALDVATGGDMDVADPPLAEALDVEALDQLFATGNDSVRASFGVWNLAVVVTPTEVRVFEYQS
jgi:hypothetical protein